MRKIVSLIMCFLCIGAVSAFSSCELTDYDDTSSSQYQILEGVDMQVDYDSYLGYSVEISGQLKNVSRKEFSYVSVTYAVYGASGEQLETAMDNTNYLQAGATWRFKATMFGWVDEKPTSCKIVDVTVW